jgi:hypothetical protein
VDRWARFSRAASSATLSAEVFAENGLFKGGRAASFTFAVACGFTACGEDFEERTVFLRR